MTSRPAQAPNNLQGSIDNAITAAKTLNASLDRLLRALSGATSLSPARLELLKRIEVLRLQPYDDQTSRVTDHWVRGATIGYGRLIAQSEWKYFKNGITEEQADEMLQASVAQAESTVKRGLTTTVTANQFDALTLLAFNIGAGSSNRPGFSNSSVLRPINDPQAKTPYPDLESAWKAWNRSHGNVSNGLIRRRNAEWDIFNSGIYEW